MLEDENEQKYPFLLVFLQFCGLRGTSKYMSLADVRSAIYIYKSETYGVLLMMAEFYKSVEIGFSGCALRLIEVSVYCKND